MNNLTNKVNIHLPAAWVLCSHGNPRHARVSIVRVVEIRSAVYSNQRYKRINRTRTPQTPVPVFKAGVMILVPSISHQMSSVRISTETIKDDGSLGDHRGEKDSDSNYYHGTTCLRSNSQHNVDDVGNDDITSTQQSTVILQLTNP